MFTYKKLYFLILSCYVSTPSLTWADTPEVNAQIGDIIVTGSRVTKDQEGKSNVYHKNVTNIYIDKKYLDKYNTESSADVLKGINGVYSMDARNGNSISPNIRGLAGQGRIPLTVDGTEQAVNIWMHMYGALNRNYVDPALFRSVYVEKGPSLTRNVKSGIGGSIEVHTIDADDVIPKGKNFGISVKLETASNTRKRAVNPLQWEGTDYRDLSAAQGGGAAVNNTTMTDTYKPYPLLFPPARKERGKDKFFNLQDNAIAVAAAYKNEIVDGLIAYSYRSKGNYFAGRHKASDYLNNPQYSKDDKMLNLYYPNAALRFPAGKEVLNSDNLSKTLLLKNNWHFGNGQQINLEYMRSHFEFGETPASMGFMYDEFSNLEANGKKISIPAMDFLLNSIYPRSVIKQNTYKIGYKWQPENSRWINFAADAWETDNKATRYATGGNIYYVKDLDPAGFEYAKNYEQWRNCQYANQFGYEKMSKFSFDPTVCTQPNIKNFNPNTKPPKSLANTDGRFNLQTLDFQKTHHKRYGLEVSNLFQLTDKLKLLVSGDMQYENLHETVNLGSRNIPFSLGFIPPTQAAVATGLFGPRSGHRHEWGMNFNFEWQPTQWLTLTAGARYNRYWAFDDELAKRRRQKDPDWAASRTHKTLNSGYLELADDQYAGIVRKSFKVSDQLDQLANSIGYENIYKENGDYNIDYPGVKKYVDMNNELDQLNNKLNIGYTVADNGLVYYKQDKNSKPLSAYIPIENGKIKESQDPFLNGQIDLNKKVKNPQGKTGSYSQYYLACSEQTANRKLPCMEGDDSESNNYPDLTEKEKWVLPKRQKGSAWSPVFSMTLTPSPYSRIFLRYAQMTRFPSLFEIAATTTGPISGGSVITAASKPERSNNFEIGYSHDLTQFFPNLDVADIRLSYYNTSIKNYIDRNDNGYIIQFDKKKISGLELSGRFDTGRVFGNLGISYRLKQQVCDRGLALAMDPYYGKVPSCTASSSFFYGGQGLLNMQPKYSINFDLGARLLENKRLTMGIRGIYHSKSQDPGFYAVHISNMSVAPVRWHPMFVIDTYLNYQINKQFSLNFNINNITNQYYIDPMARVVMPGPGRKFTLGIQGKF